MHLCKSGQMPCQSRVQVNVSYRTVFAAWHNLAHLIGHNSDCKLTTRIKYHFLLQKCHKIEVQETLV